MIGMSPQVLELPDRFNLDLGCGYNKQPGYVGMDKRSLECVDIVHDVEKIPWPIPDDRVAICLCSHLIEHLNPQILVDFFNEVWRVMIPDGSFMVSTPYAGSFGAFQDPTHVRPGFNEATFTYFDPRQPLWQIYRPKPFFIESLIFDPATNIEVRLRAIKPGSKGISKEDLKRFGVC